MSRTRTVAFEIAPAEGVPMAVLPNEQADAWTDRRAVDSFGAVPREVREEIARKFLAEHPEAA